MWGEEGRDAEKANNYVYHGRLRPSSHSASPAPALVGVRHGVGHTGVANPGLAHCGTTALKLHLPQQEGHGFPWTRDWNSSALILLTSA